MIKILAVAFGGSLGALARYGISAWAQRKITPSFPIGTLIVNVGGCLLIGFLMSLALDRKGLSEEMRLFLTVGFMGALTTFSTFGYETVLLAQNARWGFALLNVFGNLFLGLIAVLAGFGLSKLI